MGKRHILSYSKQVSEPIAHCTVVLCTVVLCTVVLCTVVLCTVVLCTVVLCTVAVSASTAFCLVTCNAILYSGSQAPAFHDVKNSFATSAFCKLYELVPVKNEHQLELIWHLPCMSHLYRSKPLHYVGWLLGHEGSGSVLSYLRKRYGDVIAPCVAEVAA